MKFVKLLVGVLAATSLVACAAQADMKKDDDHNKGGHPDLHASAPQKAVESNGKPLVVKKVVVKHDHHHAHHHHHHTHSKGKKADDAAKKDVKAAV